MGQILWWEFLCPEEILSVRSFIFVGQDLISFCDAQGTEPPIVIVDVAVALGVAVAEEVLGATGAEVPLCSRAPEAPPLEGVLEVFGYVRPQCSQRPIMRGEVGIIPLL